MRLTRMPGQSGMAKRRAGGWKTWMAVPMCLALLLAMLPSGHAELLTGGVRQQVLYDNAHEHALNGRVVSQQSGQPLSDVLVSLPDLGVSARTDADGGFILPVMPTQPTIISLSRKGYVPHAETLEYHALQDVDTSLEFRLKTLEQTVVLDDELRHLGDNTYSKKSAGARRFKLGRDSQPVLQKPFILPGSFREALGSVDRVVLEVGTIIGLDTREAQRQGQSHFSHSASPMIVRLNGRVIGHIALNGDSHQIMVDKRLLLPSGINMLEIATGYHYPDGQRIDYDDIELMVITLAY
ncbi:MAG: carboxypeptidase regulatory-like domain-containing protein [Candidatus Melainabacteria bacterium]